MEKSVGDHALEIIEREGPSLTHHIAATFFIAGGRFGPLRMGQHNDEVAKEKLTADPRLKYDVETDRWDKT